MELLRNYITLTEDLGRVMSRVQASDLSLEIIADEFVLYDKVSFFTHRTLAITLRIEARLRDDFQIATQNRCSKNDSGEMRQTHFPRSSGEPVCLTVR